MQLSALSSTHSAAPLTPLLPLAGITLVLPPNSLPPFKVQQQQQQQPGLPAWFLATHSPPYTPPPPFPLFSVSVFGVQASYTFRLSTEDAGLSFQGQHHPPPRTLASRRAAHRDGRSLYGGLLCYRVVGRGGGGQRPPQGGSAHVSPTR